MLTDAYFDDLERTVWNERSLPARYNEKAALVPPSDGLPETTVGNGVTNTSSGPKTPEV
jgi:hypothetical protein